MSSTDFRPHDEPTADASRRAVEVLQVLIAWQRNRVDRALRQPELRREVRDDARERWAPALDEDKAKALSTQEALRVWTPAAAMMPEGHPVDEQARPAADAAEARLRELQPDALARYDQLRSEGLAPLDAMREALPLMDLGDLEAQTASDLDDVRRELNLAADAPVAEVADRLDAESATPAQAAGDQAGRVAVTTATVVLEAESLLEREATRTTTTDTPSPVELVATSFPEPLPRPTSASAGGPDAAADSPAPALGRDVALDKQAADLGLRVAGLRLAAGGEEATRDDPTTPAVDEHRVGVAAGQVDRDTSAGLGRQAAALRADAAAEGLSPASAKAVTASFPTPAAEAVAAAAAQPLRPTAAPVQATATVAVRGRGR